MNYEEALEAKGAIRRVHDPLNPPRWRWLIFPELMHGDRVCCADPSDPIVRRLGLEDMRGEVKGLHSTTAEDIFVFVASQHGLVSIPADKLCLDDSRDFDGFCDPCGGFRRHRLRCPAKPVAGPNGGVP